MKHPKHLFLKQLKHLRYSLKPHTIPEKFLHKDVPYFSQWESRKLNKQILEKSIGTGDDPNWKASGAETKKEYHDWSWAGCGMACTKMLLAHRTGEVMPLVTLGKKCAAYGGYTMPLEASAGLLYKPYIQFLEKEFGWKAKVITATPLQEVVHELSRGNYVIASVHPAIRHPESVPETTGGHLILLLGYDKPKRLLYFHNPSGISKKTQEYAEISFDDFGKFFSNRGIVINGQEPSVK